MRSVFQKSMFLSIYSNLAIFSRHWSNSFGNTRSQQLQRHSRNFFKLEILTIATILFKIMMYQKIEYF